jgi:hypothetical protein
MPESAASHGRGCPRPPAQAALTMTIAQRCHAHDGDDAGKSQRAWNGEVARDTLVSALVNDANTIVDEARHEHETIRHRRNGYQTDVAIEPDTGLFTAGVPTKATGEDNNEAVVGLAVFDDEPDPPGGSSSELGVEVVGVHAGDLTTARSGVHGFQDGGCHGGRRGLHRVGHGRRGGRGPFPA